MWISLARFLRAPEPPWHSPAGSPAPRSPCREDVPDLRWLRPPGRPTRSRSSRSARNSDRSRREFPARRRAPDSPSAQCKRPPSTAFQESSGIGHRQRDQHDRAAPPASSGTAAKNFGRQRLGFGRNRRADPPSTSSGICNCSDKRQSRHRAPRRIRGRPESLPGLSPRSRCNPERAIQDPRR